MSLSAKTTTTAKASRAQQRGGPLPSGLSLEQGASRMRPWTVAAGPVGRSCRGLGPQHLCHRKDGSWHPAALCNLSHATTAPGKVHSMHAPTLSQELPAAAQRRDLASRYTTGPWLQDTSRSCLPSAAVAPPPASELASSRQQALLSEAPLLGGPAGDLCNGSAAPASSHGCKSLDSHRAGKMNSMSEHARP
jgi:hypothetical protein